MITISSFIGQNIDDISKYYTFEKELGSGSYGKVFLVSNIKTKEKFACKQMNKRKIANKERFKVEIDLLKATDHPNIIRLYELFEDKIFLYLIMEVCSGGELFDRLAERSKSKNLYNEKQACEIFKQLMSAINYCHVHGVCHRDIKPENILFASKKENSVLKVADFGLSKIFTSENNKMTSIVGTTYYMSPEVINGDYDEKCDIWSAGCLLYILICGRPPFFAKSNVDLMNKIKGKRYSLNYPEFRSVSSDLIDLLSRMLCDADCRFTAQQVLEHTWVKNSVPNSKDTILSLDLNSLVYYSSMNKFKQGVYAYISTKLSETDSEELIRIFHSFDKNRDGVVTLKEFKEGINYIKERKRHSSSDISNFDVGDLENLFRKMDLDKNGLINYTEFVASALNHKQLKRKDLIYDAFKAFDTDKCGSITMEELKEIIRPGNKEENAYLEELFEKYDLDKDKKISLDEFMNMVDQEDDYF